MESSKLPTLPVSLANFSLLRHKGRLYVDKTALLQKLIEEGDYYFLARPRRFGKSLTISTLEAMFRGHAELFTDLAAKAWVEKQAQNPSAVLCLDFSKFDCNGSPQDLVNWINRKLIAFAKSNRINIAPEVSCAETLDSVLDRVSQKQSLIAMLIDEYDAPVLGALPNQSKANAFRAVLREFYKALKACNAALSFLLITGICKLTKSGIFSALNNLQDISMSQKYSTLTGYTQFELESNFASFLEAALLQNTASSRQELLAKIKKYYNGFSFDGQTKVYNPFSLLNFFSEYRFSNYWYESGSVSFIENYFKSHNIESPEKYHCIRIDETELAAREIEEASPESFLYQAGYLTIAERREDCLILDYPNQEVVSSLAKMYLSKIYPIADYAEVGKRLWQAVESADIVTLVREYNAALASLPYQDFAKKQNSGPGESFYRALFLMLLRGCGFQAHGEIPSCRGRSDVLIETPTQILIIEFKLAHSAKEIAAKRKAGEQQLLTSGYLEPYANTNTPVSSAVFVVDAQKRQIVL